MDCTAQEILDKMSACQQQLKDFKAQLVNVANRKSEIVSRLQSLVNETHPHHEVLMTIFNRKVKRVRKSAAEDEDHRKKPARTAVIRPSMKRFRYSSHDALKAVVASGQYGIMVTPACSFRHRLQSNMQNCSGQLAGLCHARTET